MQDFAILVLSVFKDHGEQAITHPPDGQILLRNIGSLIEPVWAREELLNFLKADATMRIRPEPVALFRSKSKRI